MKEDSGKEPFLLYDGVCGFCNKTVQTILYYDKHGTMRFAAYLGGVWKLLLIAYIIPTPIRDFFYDLFARYRYRIFGKYDSCMLPPPEVRARFLDVGEPLFGCPRSMQKS